MFWQLLERSLLLKPSGILLSRLHLLRPSKTLSNRTSHCPSEISLVGLFFSLLWSSTGEAHLRMEGFVSVPESLCPSQQGHYRGLDLLPVSGSLQHPCYMWLKPGSRDHTPTSPASLFSSQLGLSKGSTTSPDTTTFWGPGVQTLGSVSAI